MGLYKGSKCERTNNGCINHASDGASRLTNSRDHGGCEESGNRDKISEFEEAEPGGCLLAFHGKEDKGIGSMKNLELMTLESAFFACLEFLTKNWDRILLVLGTLIIAFGGIYYYSKMLKQSAHPAIVELVRFCIVPLQEWLKRQKDYQTEELNLPMLLGRGIGDARKSLRRNQLPDGGRLQQKFTSLLEKFKLKERWDKEVKEYNEICKKLNNKKEELKGNLETLVEELNIQKYYKDSGYAATYEEFKVILINDFLPRLKGKLSDGAWRYVGQADFDIVKEKVKDHINEIDRLVEGKSRIVSNLEDLIEEEVIGKLEKDYNLTPSELSPAIELYEGEADFM
jgi:hypothetical protein